MNDDTTTGTTGNDTKARDVLALTDRINAHLTQLKSLLVVATDGHFTREVAPNIRDGYLWACMELAISVNADFQALTEGGAV